MDLRNAFIKVLYWPGQSKVPISPLYSLVLKVLPRASREEKSEKLSVPRWSHLLNSTEQTQAVVQGGSSGSTGHLLRSIANTARGHHMYKPATALARSFQTSVVQILRIQVSETPAWTVSVGSLSSYGQAWWAVRAELLRGVHHLTDANLSQP